MIDTLFYLNQKLNNNSRLFERTRLNSLGRCALRVTANIILPLYLKAFRPTSTNREVSIPVIVSLTSFPARIGKLWIVIECMLRQKSRPEKIMLWLSREQFPNELADLPKKLVEQTERGLDIKFVDNDIRSHKKYYYAFKEFKDKFVLTIDDDLILPSTFVGDTYKCYLRHPNSVIANFGSHFKWDNNINYLKRLDIRIVPEETRYNLFFGSGGGTLFNPKTLVPYLDDIHTIWELCPTADDIYLNAIARLAGHEVTFVKLSTLLSLNNRGDQKLTDLNGNLYDPCSRNADQLRALVAHLHTKWGKNPFDINAQTNGRKPEHTQ